jgi:hypothetical protein
MSIPDPVIREIRAWPVVAPLPRATVGPTRSPIHCSPCVRSRSSCRDIAPELVGKSVSPRARMRQMEKGATREAAGVH